ncbi:hypothetical protein BU24DRAFT_350562 [Aaosphaeria arxii CBS 175.79]|uniref:Pentatricopeptide repeat protein n=1 Tax=Aaosphaeria arxii CBS 175.79 TaxID=1450172 RepID=A0A6A5XKH4_9PLEO|nr:uncharacterized protein BU24DRAFT_350562 [Aaosphaeria arxii CBS 175.79]KAF2013351.1 hypothetical protein BU24DRAFT_350562 [Aaosphaeria arxii CBS 175.79]
MDAVGKAMTVQQRVRWIEGLFFNKQEYCALREWEDDRLESDPSKRHDYKPEHLQSGARMYAYADNVRRSRQLLDELYELHPSWDPSIILPVFRAHARSKGRDHRSMAWGLYEKRLNFPIKLSRKEMDGYFIGFIEAQDLRHAIIVFNSMLKDGHLTGKLSERMINRVLRKLNLLYRLGTNIESMTSIALSVISNLPRPYHPHLFGDWLKAAVRARAPEAAAQILEIMFQRGTTPRTIHFNLFLRTLLRSEKRQHDLKAENIGWEMVDQCDKTSPPEAPHINTADAIVSYGKADQEGRNNKSLERITPRANVVTFGLLMLRHSNLSQWEHVEYLSRRLRELGIPPNVDVLNSMIRYYSARGNYNKVWETYKTMTHVPNNNGGVFPNGMTFRLLWRTLRIALGDKNRKENIELPSPRYLLAETIRWTDMVRSRWDAQRFREGLAAENLEAISTLVMHCFSYTDDLAGSIVALYALRRRFDIMPTKELATVLQTHAAWTDLHLETKSVRAQFSLSKTFPNKMQQLGRIFAILKDARSKRLNITDGIAVTLSKDEQAELNLNLLSEFVRVISKRQHSPETIEAMIDQAKKDVGLPTLKIGDMDAFEVL